MATTLGKVAKICIPCWLKPYRVVSGLAKPLGGLSKGAMCGIFGRIGVEPAAEALLRQVHDVQRHRGPDGVGSWSTAFGSKVLTFGFQRLAIIDLSPEAMQPFVNADTGSVIVFNGEIYNYVELRRELEQAGQSFKTRSDTEVLLRALDTWGLTEGLRKLNGMFAFAWFNGRDKSLALARDRAGEKPLYYSFDGETLLFASEIKTILAASGQRKFKPNNTTIYRLLAQSISDDTRETFFEGIEQVMPGEVCRVVINNGTLELVPQLYWDVNRVSQPARISTQDAVEQCRNLLLDSVRIRLRSDVPLGFLLSGGIDSTALVGLAIENGIAPSTMAAFSSIGGDPRTDETKWIDIACRHFGISSNKTKLSPLSDGFEKQLTDAVYAHDAPFTSLSVVAQYALMQHASTSGRIVLLSGQGADELFCGYAKYSAFYVQQLLRERRPFAASKAVAQFAWVGTVLPQVTAEELRRYAPALFGKEARSLYGPRLQGIPLEDIGLAGNDVRGRQLLDLQRFSVPMINHYEDRVSMAWSRELRMPFLDPRIIEFSLSLPDEAKLGGGWTKYVLRKAAEPYMPREITWRQDKKGYSMPTLHWLRQDMVPFIRKRLNEDALVFRHGYASHDVFWSLYEKMIRTGSTRHISTKEVIGILTLESWMRSFEDALDFGENRTAAQRQPRIAARSRAAQPAGQADDKSVARAARRNSGLRVAQVTSAHPPNDNRITFHIAATLADAGYDTTVIAPPASGDAAVRMPANVGLILLKRRNGRFKRFTLRHLEILKLVARDFDVVHIHDPDLLIVGALLTCIGKKVVYDAHECYRDDLTEKTWIPSVARIVVRPALIAAEWTAAHAFSGVVSASADIHDAIAPRRGAIIRNFPRQVASVETGVPSYEERDYTAGYFGSIDELRHGGEIIEAFASLRQQQRDARLILAGSISLPGGSDAIRRRLAELQIEHYPYMSRPEMAALMARCRVGLALYQHTNAYEKVEFSTKVLEYALTGTPVIGGPHPQVVRRFIRDYDIGIAIDDAAPDTIARAIVRITSDPGRWIELSRHARETAPRYSWASESQKLTELYQAITAGVDGKTRSHAHVR